MTVFIHTLLNNFKYAADLLKFCQMSAYIFFPEAAVIMARNTLLLVVTLKLPKLNS